MNPSESRDQWQPLILNLQEADDAETFRRLHRDGKVWAVHDTIAEQLHDLIRAQTPDRNPGAEEMEREQEKRLQGASLRDYGRWIYFPWSGRLVHLLPPAEFRRLRLDRNRNKITAEEQERLARITVGVVGLSVGNAVALTLALEAGCGHLKLADFDRLDLSNMNRIRASVSDIGLHKCVLAARQILEMDPYLKLSLFTEGLTEENLDDFLQGGPKVDILVDECDGLDMKVRMRERARQLGVPVLMETSDRGMLDVERFDEEPTRPLFHGLVGDLEPARLKGLRNEEKVPIVLAILGVNTLSARFGASLVEIERTIKTWPQLGSDVTLGGASVAAAVRRIALGQPLASGRRYVDMGAALDAIAPLEKPEPSPAPEPLTTKVGEDAPLSPFQRFMLEHALMAPSGGNCQPWRFHVHGETLWLVHDRQRSKNLLDVGHRASLLALGAALENISIAASHRGQRAVITPFPEPGNDAVTARIDFDGEIGEPERERAAQFEWVGKRCTNRRLSPRSPLTEPEISALQEAARSAGLRLELRTEAAALDEIGRILGAGDRLRFLNPALHREVMAELRWTPDEARRTGDGLDIATLEMKASEEAALHLLRRPDVAALLREQRGGQALEESAQKAVASASAVGVLSAVQDTSLHFLEAGRGFQRLWHTATALGLALQPMTALLYMFALCHTPDGRIFDAHEQTELLFLRQRLQNLFTLSETQPAAMLFRLSRAGEPTARSGRAALEPMLRRAAPLCATEEV